MKAFKAFLKDNQERVLFGVVLVLVAIIGFKAGILHERSQVGEEIKVYINNEKRVTEEEKKAIALGQAVQRKGLTEVAENNSVGKDVVQKCKFVGSKNSDKYHAPTCQWSTRIKEENRVCFESEESAKSQGYQPGSCNK